MPAYQMPPLELLFEPLMESFLETRSDVMSQQNGVAEIDLPESGDIEMEVDEVGSLSVAGNQKVRKVDEGEMELFVNLFKLHTLNL